MDTEKIKHFCTIVEVGSLTRASEILNISHSGLSKSMNVLQEELGVKLFVPQGRGLEVTPEGKKIYHQSKEIWNLYEQMKSGVNLVPTNKTLRLGLSEILSIFLSGDIAKEIFHRTQKIIDFHDLKFGEAEIKILEGQLDFALTFTPFLHKEIEYLSIKKIMLGIFFVNSNFESDLLEHLPFVVPSMSTHADVMDFKNPDGWPLNLKRNIRFKSSSISSALNIVETNHVVIFIPKFCVPILNKNRLSHLRFKEFYHENQNLKISKELKNLHKVLYLLKKKNIEETEEMKIVGKIIRKLC
jgi:DNA-binding transcriptional LysR family regulator